MGALPACAAMRTEVFNDILTMMETAGRGEIEFMLFRFTTGRDWKRQISPPGVRAIR